MAKDLDPGRLLLLRRVVEAGSLTAASASAGLSVSAVSQQLSKLEREAGTKLLERHSHGVRPTQAGALLAEHALAIAGKLAEARRDLDDLSGQRGGQLRLGTFPTAAASILPSWVAAMRRRWPEVELAVQGGLRADLHARLEGHEVDLILTWDYPWERAATAAFRTAEVRSDPTVLLVVEDDPLTRLSQVTAADLARRQWVVRGDLHPMRHVLQTLVASAEEEPCIAYRANDYQEMQAVVATGLRIGLAPSIAVTAPMPGVRVLDLPPQTPGRRILAAWRPSHELTATERRALQLLLRTSGRAAAAG